MKNLELISFIFDVEFVWGYVCNVAGFSKSPSPYLLSPPTTVIGAIGAQIAKERELGENKGKKVISILLAGLKAIGLRPLNFRPVAFQDASSIIAVKITSGKLRPDPLAKDKKRPFDTVGRGKVSAVSQDENAPTLRVGVVFDLSLLESSELTLSGKDLEEAIWRINRIGSKESVCSVTEVKKLVPQVIREGELVTKYSHPAASLEGVSSTGKWFFETYLDPFHPELRREYSPFKFFYGIKTSPALRPFRVPICPDSKIRGKLTSNYEAYSLRGNFNIIIGPRR